MFAALRVLLLAAVVQLSRLSSLCVDCEPQRRTTHERCDKEHKRVLPVPNRPAHSVTQQHSAVLGRLRKIES